MGMPAIWLAHTHKPACGLGVYRLPATAVSLELTCHAVVDCRRHCVCRLGLLSLPHFRAEDGLCFRTAESKTDFAVLDFQDDDFDIVADSDGFIWLSREYQHCAVPLQKGLRAFFQQPEELYI